jgi:phosphoglycerol transferase
MSAEQPTPQREPRWIACAWYVALAAATVGFLTYNFRLDRADLTIPLGTLHNDSVGLLSLVTAIHESGRPWVVDRLGAPGTAERFDYPLPEHAHYLAIRGLLAVTDSPFLTFNLWCLFSYPITALCAFAVCRALGVSRPMAFAVAGIYTFLPYHAGRLFQHTMLAYYHTVPLVLLPTIWIMLGRLPFFGPADVDGRRRFFPFNATTAWTILLAAIVAVTSPYYAFFGCFFLVVSGIYRGLSERSFRPLVAGLSTAAVLTAVGFACSLPFVIEKREHGDNPAVAHRHANEADVYCLKVTELVLPFGDHRVRSLGHITRLYNAESINVNENRDAVLGTVGAIGFLLLCGRLLVARGGPTLLGGLAVLNVAALVLGASGGLGGLFNYLVFPQIRCYNRVCIFIAFWSLLAVAISVDRWAANGRSRRVWLAAFALLSFGVWDVTTERQAPRYSAIQARHQAWAGFVNRMEEAMPPGAMIFQLPAVSYPEAGTTHELQDYSHLACHAYSKTLRWSYGTNRNRRWDCWQQYVAGLPTPDMVRALALADFAGVYVDRRGYADHGERLIGELRAILGPEAVTSESGDQLLFSLAPAIQTLRSNTPAADCERERSRLLNRPCVLCQDGFLRWSVSYPPEPWRATHAAQMRLINPSDTTRRLTLTMTWQRLGPGDKDVTISGPTLGISRHASLPKELLPFTLDLDLPPGEHVLRFDTTPRPFGPAHMHAAWSATDIRLVERD